MPTLPEVLREVRERWKADAEHAAAQLSDDQLRQVHGELVRESNAHAHEYTDVLIYIDAIRAEYHNRVSSGA